MHTSSWPYRIKTHVAKQATPSGADRVNNKQVSQRRCTLRGKHSSINTISHLLQLHGDAGASLLARHGVELHLQCRKVRGKVFRQRPRAGKTALRIQRHSVLTNNILAGDEDARAQRSSTVVLDVRDVALQGSTFLKPEHRRVRYAVAINILWEFR